jgi:hypothetical protein
VPKAFLNWKSANNSNSSSTCLGSMGSTASIETIHFVSPNAQGAKVSTLTINTVGILANYIAVKLESVNEPIFKSNYKPVKVYSY